MGPGLNPTAVPRCMAAALDGQCHQGFPSALYKGIMKPSIIRIIPLNRRPEKGPKIGILGGVGPLNSHAGCFVWFSLKKKHGGGHDGFNWCSTPNKNETRLILADVGWWNTTNLATTTCTKWQATPSHGMCFLAKKDPKRIGTWTLKVTRGVHLRNLT